MIRVLTIRFAPASRYGAVGKQWDDPLLPLTVHIFDQSQDVFTLFLLELVGSRVVLVQ
jgi:hypothetical protein